jgi:predicted PurR-regulated permease PerM
VFGLIGIVLGPVITATVSGLFEAYAGPAEIVGSRPHDEERLLP